VFRLPRVIKAAPLLVVFHIYVYDMIRMILLTSMKFLVVFHIDVHNVVEDNEVANVVEVVVEDERDSDSIDGREDSPSIDDIEDNLYRHHHDAEDDVGVDESLAVLPEPMNGEAVKSYPEGHQEESHDICIKKRKE